MNDVDGKIVIGTEVQLDEFEEAMREIQKSGMGLEDVEKELDKIDARIREIYKDSQVEDIYGDKQLLRVTKELTKAEEEELDNLHEREQLLVKMRDYLTPAVEKTTEVKEKTKSISDEMGEAMKHMDEWENGTYTLSNGQRLVNTEYQNSNQELGKINFNLENIGKQTTKAIKKIGRWALAVFGVRSAYMFVRSAINTITEQDEQLKADITYVKTALAYSIEPLVRGIVNLAKLLVQYLGYIIQAWTKRDIFAKSAKSLAGANKSAKDLNKSLLGFDKINKLSGSKDSGGGGVSSSIKPLEEGEEPGWLKWIGDNGNTIATILMSIAAGLVAIKLGANLIMASAVGVAVFSIVMAVKDLIELFKDPTWENFGNIIIDLGIAFMAIGVIVNGLPVIIGGAIALVVGLIIKYWDQCKEYIVSGLMIFVDTFEGVFLGIGEFVENILRGIFTVFANVENAIVSLFKGDFKSTFTYLGKAIGNIFITLINTVINAINTVVSPIRALVVAIGKVSGKKWTMDNIKIPKVPMLAQGGIVHNPGRGVMMGDYIAGEGRNPEAVIPLDDATLDKLGQAIARHSQINATIVNEMDGRVLSKNLARVQSENAFARNGGY